MPDEPETIGDRIRKLRGTQTQAELASQLMVSKNTIGMYERGERRPEAEVLAKMHEALGVDINWLLTGSGQMRREAAPAEAVPPVVAETDDGLMRSIGNGIDSVYRAANIRLGPGDLAQLSARMYADIINSGARTPEEKGPAMRALLERLRQDLRKPTIDQTNQRLA